MLGEPQRDLTAETAAARLRALPERSLRDGTALDHAPPLPAAP
jgi:hypothetical protein